VVPHRRHWTHRSADGFLSITGRAKDLIISGGMNVYPREVELALEEAGDVARAAVVGVPSERWGEAVVAAIVPAPGAAVDEDALLAFVSERLAPYKRPKWVVPVDELPSTTWARSSPPRWSSWCSGERTRGHGAGDASGLPAAARARRRRAGRGDRGAARRPIRPSIRRRVPDRPVAAPAVARRALDAGEAGSGGADRGRSGAGRGAAARARRIRDADLELARGQARTAEAELRPGRRAVAAARLPVAIKDVIDVAGVPTRLGTPGAGTGCQNAVLPWSTP
jgi:hypothetical protein